MVLKDLLLAAGIVKGLKDMRADDSLALPSPKAYSTHNGTLTAGLLASSPRRSFHHSQLGTKVGTHRHKVVGLGPAHRNHCTSCELIGELPASLPPPVSPAAGRSQPTLSPRGSPAVSPPKLAATLSAHRRAPRVILFSRGLVDFCERQPSRPERDRPPRYPARVPFDHHRHPGAPIGALRERPSSVDTLALEA